MLNNVATHIEKNKKLKESEDYNFLRKKGLEHIQELASKTWTDYNIHDPGITITEMICYAITDLSHRTNYQIEDILADGISEDSSNNKMFFTAREILPCNPVTLSDFRKVMIDVPGVKNAWLEISKEQEVQLFVDCVNNKLLTDSKLNLIPLNLRGLYNVHVEFEKDVPVKNFDSVKERLHECRNLCEDFYEFNEVEDEEIIICADLEVTAEADIVEVLAEVYYQVEDFLSPSVTFYSVKELMDKGRSVEEIFEGPVLSHGFIDNNELNASAFREVIHSSDIINIIMDIEGVVAVKKILLANVYKNVQQTTGEKWCLKVGKNRKTRLARDEKGNFKSNIFMYKGLIPYTADREDVRDLFKEKSRLDRHEKLNNDQYNLKIPKGETRNLPKYYSIQNDFPLVYGIGEEGLPLSATKLRKSQAKQLKAYLLFFDQIFANYFSQLSNIGQLFSMNRNTKHTYFTQAISSVKDIDELYVNYGGLTQKIQNISESDKLFQKRRNRFLDHLIARFCEQFTDYVLLLYSLDRKRASADLIEDKLTFLSNYPEISSNRGKAFNYRVNEIVENTNNVSGLQKRISGLLGIKSYTRRSFQDCIKEHFEIYKKGDADEFRFRLKDVSGKYILRASEWYQNKELALLDIVKIMGYCLDETNYIPRTTGTGRFTFDINEGDKTIAVGSQFLDSEKDLSLEIKNSVNILKKIDEECERFYLVEHILLRPKSNNDTFLKIRVEDDCNCCSGLIDPYSFRITVIVPYWPDRFRNMDFRSFFESTFRMEAPAHVHVKICWVTEESIMKFEKSYNDWLFENAKDQPDVNTLTEHHTRLINALGQLRSVYPESKLYDCKGDGKEMPVVLDHSFLGTIKENENE